VSPILPPFSPSKQRALAVFGLNDDYDYDYDYDVNEDHDEEESLDYSENQDITKIDDLVKELGEMDQERKDLLQEIHTSTSSSQVSSSNNHLETTANMERVAAEMQQEEDIDEASKEEEEEAEREPSQLLALVDHRANDSRRLLEQEDSQALVNTTTDSSALDKTISLLYSLKDLMTNQGDSDEKETSILEQLEVLSEMMQDETSSISTLQAQNRSLTLYDGNDEDNGNTSLTSFQSAAVEPPFHNNASIREDDPWPALVEELRQRIAFLEHDRDEVVRITKNMLDQERESHQVELQAAVATTKRKAHEELQSLQMHTHQHMKQLYQTLCVHCQRRIYTAIP
jgi:hypothetical protein